ncbi:hypothetical protein [Herbaspirillum sp. YR522]|uniref:hypothetical protein n=1 Tax=Herbaspirillum sp. YR522 TaxID=1144342 RepID=UPI00026FA28B|nr:hypothetical protein [Herbaspirillum sp. YR522]EJN06445.1 hypothetical protein PMI40_02231 [Herbaspirillum sp. YR522]
MKTNYSTIDHAICAAIYSGADNFTRLTTQRSVMDLADSIAGQENTQPRKGYAPVFGWRILDRRLQALRKAGRIIYKGGRWQITTTPSCDDVGGEKP